MTKNKKGRGRPKRPINPTTCARIIELRGRESREKVADALRISPQSLARYEKGDRPTPTDVLKDMARYWGVFPEYLTGETDIKNDPIAFKHEQEQKVLDGFSRAVEKNEYDIRKSRLENLFTFCGFRYGDSYAGELMHSINDETGFVDPAPFTDAELEAILSKIHDLIELECFRKTAKEKALHSD